MIAKEKMCWQERKQGCKSLLLPGWCKGRSSGVGNRQECAASGPLHSALVLQSTVFFCIALYDDAAHCTVLAAISLAAGELSKSFISTATQEKPSQQIVANNLHNMHSPLQAYAYAYEGRGLLDLMFEKLFSTHSFTDLHHWVCLPSQKTREKNIPGKKMINYRFMAFSNIVLLLSVLNI